jgi:hypothetical protein
MVPAPRRSSVNHKAMEFPQIAIQHMSMLNKKNNLFSNRAAAIW